MTAAKVQVLGKWTAVSTAAVTPGKVYMLAPLDHLMSAHTLRLIFYYRAGLELNRDRLRDSLAEVLSYYPVMTGRLARDADGRWYVKCNDAGVRVIDARVDVGLDEWFGSAKADDEMGLIYWEPIGDDPSIWSPFYIQITLFADESYALGLSCTHLHADPTCATLFVKAWSDVHGGAAICHPPFFHPPALHRHGPDLNLSTPSANFLSTKSNTKNNILKLNKMSSATFVFSSAAVNSVVSAAGNGVSPAVALASLFWARIGSKELTLAADFRKRMQAPLPRGFYGNALHFSSIKSPENFTPTDAAAAILAHDATVEEEEYWSVVEWTESHGPQVRGLQMYGPQLTCVLLDHVPAYGAQFGTGRPDRVACWIGGGEGEGLVVIWPGSEDGGRTVFVTLPEDRAVEIYRDQEILRHGVDVCD